MDGSGLDASAVEAIEKRIVLSPFGKLLGFETERVEVDHVRVRMPFRPELTTLGEVVHGGAIGSLIDVAATAAAWASPAASLQGRGSTVGYTVNFLAPALGRELVADARVVQRGRSLSICEVAVADSEGSAVALALVTYRLSLPKPPE